MISGLLEVRAGGNEVVVELASRFLVGRYLFLASVVLAAFATAKVWWQGQRRQAGPLALFVFAHGLFVPWLINGLVTGTAERGAWLIDLDLTAGIAFVALLVGVPLGHLLYFLATRSRQRTQPHACTGGLLLVWLVCTALPVIGGRVAIAQVHARDLARLEGVLPTATRGEDDGGGHSWFSASVVHVGEDGDLRVDSEWSLWVGDDSDRNPEADTRLATFATGYAGQLSGRDALQVALGPEATCEELLRTLHAVSEALPLQERVLLSAVDPTSPTPLSVLLAHGRYLPCTVVPLRLVPPPASLTLVLSPGDGEDFELAGTLVRGRDALAGAIAELAPSCIVVSAPPATTLQHIVNVFDVVRRTPGEEMAMR